MCVKYDGKFEDWGLFIMFLILCVNWNKIIFLNKKFLISVVWILINIYIVMFVWFFVYVCDCWKIVNNVDEIIRFVVEWIVILYVW